jgi:hypothetical protein
MAVWNLIRPGAAPLTEERRLIAFMHFQDASMRTQIELGTIQGEILKRADEIKERRKIWLDIAKWSSWFFFTLGWLLAFYGQISGKEGSPPLASE